MGNQKKHGKSTSLYAPVPLLLAKRSQTKREAVLWGAISVFRAMSHPQPQAPPSFLDGFGRREATGLGGRSGRREITRPLAYDEPAAPSSPMHASSSHSPSIRYRPGPMSAAAGPQGGYDYHPSASGVPGAAYPSAPHPDPQQQVHAHMLQGSGGSAMTARDSGGGEIRGALVYPADLFSSAPPPHAFAPHEPASPAAPVTFGRPSFPPAVARGGQQGRPPPPPPPAAADAYFNRTRIELHDRDRDVLESFFETDDFAEHFNRKAAAAREEMGLIANAPPVQPVTALKLPTLLGPSLANRAAGGGYGHANNNNNVAYADSPPRHPASTVVHSAPPSTSFTFHPPLPMSNAQPQGGGGGRAVVLCWHCKDELLRAAAKYDADVAWQQRQVEAEATGGHKGSKQSGGGGGGRHAGGRTRKQQGQIRAGQHQGPPQPPRVAFPPIGGRR